MSVYPTALSAATEPPEAPDPVDLCETCAHMVSVVDRKHSRPGLLRRLTVCVCEHDADGTDEAEIVDSKRTECMCYRRWEG